uniref:type I-F CRISPR-associated helicase Cas3f n=1 Tax=Methylomonas sp. PHL2-19 TaxID=3438878 RepID=UPI00402B1CC4
MMVTFVSQCQKKALARTRRVLDAFANRIGDNTWQTVITEEGLITVKTLLRKTATKNTAVACHWLRSRSRSELVWIVGNRRCFNAEGIVPVNRSQKTLPAFQPEHQWIYLPLIKALAVMTALLHDWGKATQCFQHKLQSKQPPDPLRHEWVSLLLFRALIQDADNDITWLQRLAEGVWDETPLMSAAGQNVKKPLQKLPDGAGLLAWLIVTHHKLPDLTWDEAKKWRGEPVETLQQALDIITADWGYRNNSEADRLQQCFQFPQGLLKQSQPWLDQLQTAANKLLKCLPLLEQVMQNGGYRWVLHFARLSLMLGDHQYSSQATDPQWRQTVALYANTDADGQPKQWLDEHLVKVAQCSATLARRLPRLESEPPSAYDLKKLQQKSSDSRFRWQDQAVAAIQRWRTGCVQTAPRFGFFAVNMASTGSGKTLANAKIMRALSPDGDSLRYVLALGLRTLTLQTGDEYRERIGLDNGELAVMIGSQAVRDLHRQTQEDSSLGSESAASVGEDNDIDFDIPEQALSVLGTLWTNRAGQVDSRKQKLLYAPVIACTIDHLMAATETARGGRHILPSLRLLSSDLVIDEIDDFDSDDLVAIGRLIHLAAMLGCKVMISSATITPALAEGYFNAYQAGWRLFAAAREAKPAIGCAWFDENDNRVAAFPLDAIETYRAEHQAFIAKRCTFLQNTKLNPPRRIGELIGLAKPEAGANDIETAYFSNIQAAVIRQHRRHASAAPHNGKRVSFGVVRMANIPPCIALTRYLAHSTDWPADVDIRIMAYHSQQVLLLRHSQEKHLDQVLKRVEPAAVYENPAIRRHVGACQAENLIFILVATPVEEVGRDHDFDWAVVEPSSYRSIIQLAGRVLRHRQQLPDAPNIGLLQYNLKALKQADDVPAFRRPGFESTENMLQSHDLSRLIPSEQLAAINAIPRIRQSQELQLTANLADLEHHFIRQLLNDYSATGPEALQGWLSGHWWLTALPQRLKPFRRQDPQQTLFDVPDQDGEFRFVEKLPQGGINPIENSYKIQRVALTSLEQQRWWLWHDYSELLEEQAERHGWSREYAALYYGEINVRISDTDRQRQTQFNYCEQLGIWRDGGD